MFRPGGAVRPVRAQGFRAVIGFVGAFLCIHVGIGLDLDIGLLAVKIIGFPGLDLFHAGTLLFLPGRVVLAGAGFGLLVLCGLVVGIISAVARFIAGRQVADQVAHGLCEGCLVAKQRDKIVQRVAGLVGHFIAPERGDPFGLLRQGPARQAFAQEKFERRGERRGLAVLHAGEAFPLTPRNKRGIEIVRRAVHGVRTNRHEPRGFGCIIHRPRQVALRPVAGMGGGIMMGKPQRDRIGLPAQRGSDKRAQLARRRAQDKPPAISMREVIAIGDLEILSRAHCLRRRGERGLEQFGRARVGLGHDMFLTRHVRHG